MATQVYAFNINLHMPGPKPLASLLRSSGSTGANVFDIYSPGIRQCGSESLLAQQRRGRVSRHRRHPNGTDTRHTTARSVATRDATAKECSTLTSEERVCCDPAFANADSTSDRIKQLVRVMIAGFGLCRCNIIDQLVRCGCKY